jgi:putative NADPH-quinone reductase
MRIRIVVRVWAHGFAQQEVKTKERAVLAHGFARQEGKTKGRAYLVVLVAGEGGKVGRQQRPAQSSVGGDCSQRRTLGELGASPQKTHGDYS